MGVCFHYELDILDYNKIISHETTMNPICTNDSFETTIYPPQMESIAMENPPIQDYFPCHRPQCLMPEDNHPHFIP
jgi:hypothetical protein